MKSCDHALIIIFVDDVYHYLADPDEMRRSHLLRNELPQGRSDLALGRCSKGIGHDKIAQEQSLDYRGDSDDNRRRMHGKRRPCAST